MTGEQPGDEGAARSAQPDVQTALAAVLIIAFAGPAINVVLAVALLTGLFMVQYPQDSESAVAEDRIRWRPTARRRRPAFA